MCVFNLLKTKEDSGQRVWDCFSASTCPWSPGVSSVLWEQKRHSTLTLGLQRTCQFVVCYLKFCADHLITLNLLPMKRLIQLHWMLTMSKSPELSLRSPLAGSRGRLRCFFFWSRLEEVQTSHSDFFPTSAFQHLVCLHTGCVWR